MEQRNSHRMKVTRTDQRSFRPVEVIRSRMLQAKANLTHIAQWKMARGRDRSHSRQTRKAIEQLFLSGLSLGWIGIARMIEQRAHHKYALRIESKRRIQQPHETSQQQSASD